MDGWESRGLLTYLPTYLMSFGQQNISARYKFFFWDALFEIFGVADEVSVGEKRVVFVKEEGGG